MIAWPTADRQFLGITLLLAARSDVEAWGTRDGKAALELTEPKRASTAWRMLRCLANGKGAPYPVGPQARPV